jgi:glycerol-3-phosphate acyltransferase PlsY
MTNLLWILLAFFCGSLPLSYWLGTIFLKVDIREYGDGNPGATNVWRAGGKWWGLLAILLDGLKGFVPVALANYLAGLTGWVLFAVSLAPLLGHAYTPFLKCHGGKALATTFGVWTGLTLYQAPIVLGISLAFWLWLLRKEGWAILAGMLSLLVYLLLFQRDLLLIAVWTGNFIILMWKYRDYFYRGQMFQSKLKQ